MSPGCTHRAPGGMPHYVQVQTESLGAALSQPCDLGASALQQGRGACGPGSGPRLQVAPVQQ